MKLKEHIEKEEKSLHQAAEELGFPYETFRRYLVGMSVPSKENMLKIMEWSNGEVQPNDFYQ